MRTEILWWEGEKSLKLLKNGWDNQVPVSTGMNS